MCCVETERVAMDSGEAANCSRQVAAAISTPFSATKAVATGKVRRSAKGVVEAMEWAKDKVLTGRVTSVILGADREAAILRKVIPGDMDEAKSPKANATLIANKEFVQVTDVDRLKHAVTKAPAVRSPSPPCATANGPDRITVAEARMLAAIPVTVASRLNQGKAAVSIRRPTQHTVVAQTSRRTDAETTAIVLAARNQRSARRVIQVSATAEVRTAARAVRDALRQPRVAKVARVAVITARARPLNKFNKVNLKTPLRLRGGWTTPVMKTVIPETELHVS